MRTALFLCLLCGCSGQLGSVLCNSDDNCPSGTYCSAGTVCADPTACAGNTAASCAVVAPGGLAALGEQNEILLSWNTVGGATGYAVRRAINSGGPYFDAATTQAGGLLDQGLSPATTYYYVVHAIGPGGPGADSLEVSALTVPAASAHLSATPSSAGITLRWDPVAGVSGYRILHAGAAGVFAKLTEPGPTPTTYLDASVASGATWSYEVLALNASGASPSSPRATATVP